jgi:hypothetical protein
MKKSINDSIPFDANRICDMIKSLSQAVRNHPSTMRKEDMYFAARVQEYLEKREQMQHIKQFRKFLMKRYKRRVKVQKLLPLLKSWLF